MPGEQIGRSIPRPFDAMGEGFDNETAQKFSAKGPALPLKADHKLQWGFNPADKVSLVLLGAGSSGFQKMVDEAKKKGFTLTMKDVPFGNFRKVKRVFAIRKSEKEEGGLKA